MSTFSLLRLPPRFRRRARRSRIATLLSVLLVLLFFTTPLYLIYKPPHFLIRHFQYRWSDVLWEVPVSEKIVALTIDDAPSEYTNEILELLKANEATATFFVIGSQVPGRETRLQHLVRDGNELGNHAMHDEPSRSLSDEELVEQIRSVEDMIGKAYSSAGVDSVPKYFRPGSGLFSERMRKVVSKLGYRLVLGGIYPHDPQIHFWKINAQHILSKIRPGGIIICHDRRSWTVPMLKMVLPELRSRGYRVVTVTELLQAAEPKDRDDP